MAEALPLPGGNKSEDEAYVLVVKTDRGWKFDRFLLEPEVQVLKDRAGQKGHRRPLGQMANKTWLTRC